MGKQLQCLIGGIPAVLALVVFYLDPPYDRYRISLLIGVLLVGLVLCLASWQRTTGRGLDPYSLFLASAYLFHAGSGYAFLIKHSDPDFLILDGAFSDQDLGRIFVLSFACIAAMHVGALAASSKRFEEVETPAVYLRTVGAVLLSISIIPKIVSHYNRTAIVAESGYMGLYQQVRTDNSAGLDVLEGFFIPGVMMLIAGARHRPWIRRVSIGMIVADAGFQFFYGLRFWPSMELFAVVLLYDALIRRIPRLPLLGAGVAAVIVAFPTISVVRNVPAAERLDPAAYTEAFDNLENPVVSILTEMGGSAATVGWTMQRVPVTRALEWGYSYFSAATTLLPSIFGGTHSAIGRSLDVWITWEVDPDTAAEGGGLGFSFIAEAFLNFGAAGAAVFVMILGALLSRLVSWAYGGRDPARIAVIATLCSSLLIFTRGESLFQMRFLVWYVLAPYCMVRGLAYVGSLVSTRRLRLQG